MDPCWMSSLLPSPGAKMGEIRVSHHERRDSTSVLKGERERARDELKSEKMAVTAAGGSLLGFHRFSSTNPFSGTAEEQLQQQQEKHKPGWMLRPGSRASKQYADPGSAKY